MITFAKGVTRGYLPLGGVVVSDDGRRAVLRGARAGRCSATARPTPATRPCCAAALAVIDIYEREG